MAPICEKTYKLFYDPPMEYITEEYYEKPRYKPRKEEPLVIQRNEDKKVELSTKEAKPEEYVVVKKPAKEEDKKEQTETPKEEHYYGKKEDNAMYEEANRYRRGRGGRRV